MATYDVTGPGGTNRPSRRNPGVRTPYLIENTIDVSAINGDSGAAQNDVLRVLDLPAETLVMEAGIEVIIYEPLLKQSLFLDARVETNLEKFKESSEIIITNRIDADLEKIETKVFTRDLFGTT